MRDDSQLPSTPDRRSEPGLRFDPGTGRLGLGTCVADVAAGADNRTVLRAYVDLAARSRGDHVGHLSDVRQDDIDALARALDLDAGDLAAQVEEVLGATRADAVRLVSRLKESRVIGGITKAATGAVLAGTLLAGAGVATAAAPSQPEVATTTTTATTAAEPAATPPPVVDGPLTEDENGVGLIPPVTQEHDGVVLIPPASIDAPGS